MSSAPAGVTLLPFEWHHAQATLRWNNDRELQRLLDRSGTISEDDHARWFNTLAGRDDTLFLAIHATPDARHIGNVWLANIDRRHRKAEVRVVIGDATARGSGYGSVALDAMALYAFDRLDLHRVYSYVLAVNPRARRAFERAGFVLEGTLRDDRWDGTQFVDTFLLGRLNPQSST